MAERFKAAVLKTVVGLNPPRVRIPVSPQKTLRKECFVVEDWVRTLEVRLCKRTNHAHKRHVCVCVSESRIASQAQRGVIPVSPQKSTPKGVFCCGRLGENPGGSTMQTNESRTQTAS